MKEEEGFAAFTEVSAKTGQGIDLLFQEILSRMIQAEAQRIQIELIRMHRDPYSYDEKKEDIILPKKSIRISLDDDYGSSSSSYSSRWSSCYHTGVGYCNNQ